MFRVFKTTFAAMLLSFFLGASTQCGGGFPSNNLLENTYLLFLLDSGVKIASSTPASGSVGIALNTNVALTFNTAMDTSTVVAQTVSGTCSGSVRISGDSFATCVGGTIAADSAGLVFTITPSTNLALDRNYQVRVTTDAQSTGGQKFSSEYTFSFRTGTSIAINPTAPSVPIGNNFNFTASGGQTPYTYSVVTSGGGSINASTGVYTAPATAVGSVTVRVTDGNGVVSDAALTVHSYNSVVLADTGLVGYWRLNETAGTAIADSSANSNNGTLNGALTTTTGGITGDADAALSFNSTTQYIDAITAPFDPAATDFTAELWFNSTSLVKNQAMVLFGQTAAGGQPWLLLDTSGTDRLATNLGGTGTAGTIPTTGVWHHAVLTKQGTTINLYVDGSLAATNIVTTVSSAGTLYIGGQGGFNLFNGSLDEVALYNRALSAADVALHYRLGKNKFLHLTPDAASLRWNVTQQLTPLGGTAPYTYSVTGGPGTVDANTGLLTAGSSTGTATVQVSDVNGNTDTVSVDVAFSPLNLGNLRLWLRADSQTAAVDGANINVWTDQSGFLGHMVHTVSASQPTWNATGLNGLPTVSFNGSAWMTSLSAGLSITGDMTIIMVARPQGGVANRAFFGRFKTGELLADNVQYLLRTDGAGNLQWYHEYGSGVDQFTTSTNAVAVGNWYYMGGVRNDTAQTVNFLLNGTTNSVGYANSATGGTSTLQRAFTASEQTMNIFQGDIAEVLIFNSALANPNLQNVCNYLNTRYALSVTCP